jgi:hypothetical protein
MNFILGGGQYLSFKFEAFMLARQSLYHLSHSASSFCFSYFSDRVLGFLPWLCWSVIFPYASCVAWIIGCVLPCLAYF